MAVGDPGDPLLSCWADWAGPIERVAITPEGRPLTEWALEQVAGFYGDEWFRRQASARRLPVVTLGDWPLTSPVAVVRLIERAAQIALLGDQLRHQLAEGPRGIRHSDNPTEFDHLDLLLEVIGLARRADWMVEVDVPSGRGTIPDLRLSRGTMRYTVEATIRGTDRRSRELDRQHRRISDLIRAVEKETGVELSVTVHQLLDSATMTNLASELIGIVRRCQETGDRQDFDAGFVSGTAFRSGDRPPDLPLLTGPVPGDDLWPRFAQRLHEKARRTEGAGITWIRIEEYSGLLLLTPAVHWKPEEQLSAPQQNVVTELRSYGHVRGVIMGTGAAPDWTPSRPEFEIRDAFTGAEVQERRLPGARRRRTFTIPVPSGPGVHLPSHLILDPAAWYRKESGWLDWALQELGQPIYSRLVSGELARRLTTS